MNMIIQSEIIKIEILFAKCRGHLKDNQILYNLT